MLPDYRLIITQMSKYTTILSFSLFTVITFCFVLCNPTTDNSSQETKEHNDAKFTDKASADDAKFVVDAYTDALLEMKMGESIKSKCVTEDAKNVAESNATLFRNFNSTLASLAARKQITVPSSLTNAQQDEIDKISNKRGIDVDKEYSDKLVSMNKDAVAQFEKASTQATDPEIRNFFTNELAAVREQLDKSLKMRDALKK